MDVVRPQHSLRLFACLGLVGTEGKGRAVCLFSAELVGAEELAEVVFRSSRLQNFWPWTQF